jgi:hypothetical protein
MNLAESELSALCGQCLERRIPDIETRSKSILKLLFFGAVKVSLITKALRFGKLGKCKLPPLSALMPAGAVCEKAASGFARHTAHKTAPASKKFFLSAALDNFVRHFRLLRG